MELPEEKKEARKAKRAKNREFQAQNLAQLPADIRVLVEGRAAQVDLSSADRITELEEMIRVLSADNETLEAENRLFEEMKVQWQAGGFAAVIADKNEEIRTLLTRVASESREKAKNFRSAEYWKAEAIKLGYRRVPGEKTG
jgi:ATPase subunit of ABC transporter with duplicated ATPase domains